MEFTWQDVIIVLIIISGIVAVRWIRAWESQWLDEPEGDEDAS